MVCINDFGNYFLLLGLTVKLSTYHKDAIIRAIIQDLPPVGNLSEELTKAAVKLMSTSCRNLYKKSPAAIRRHTTYHVDKHSVEFVCGDADLKAVVQPFAQRFELRQKVLQDLKLAIYGCSTRKVFIDRFPEFSHHAPAEHGKCDTLPAISNVVADLVKLGLVLKVERA